MDKKTIKVNSDLIKELKKIAIDQETTIQAITESVLKKYIEKEKASCTHSLKN